MTRTNILEVIQTFYAYVLKFLGHFRKALTQLADTIVLFDQGEIVELGTHKKLMHLGKKYYEMYTLQAEKYVSVDL
ncbi:MAG: hypothetical protein LBF32_04645 [Streptococcaceae bacterium]|nr:hypothetical protein [Streptococcaceae bacterium]